MRLTLLAALVLAGIVAHVTAGGSGYVDERYDTGYGNNGYNNDDGSIIVLDGDDAEVRDWSGKANSWEVAKKKKYDDWDDDKYDGYYNKKKRGSHDDDKKKKDKKKKYPKKKNNKSHEKKDKDWSKKDRSFEQDNQEIIIDDGDINNSGIYANGADGVNMHGRNKNYNLNSIIIGDDCDGEDCEKEKTETNPTLPDGVSWTCALVDQWRYSTDKKPVALELSLPYEANRLMVKLSPGVGAVGSLHVSSKMNVVPPLTDLADFSAYGNELGGNVTIDVLVSGPIKYYLGYNLNFFSNFTMITLCYTYTKVEVPDCDTNIRTNYTTNFRFCKLSLSDVECPKDLPSNAIRQVSVKFRDPNLGAFYAMRDSLPTLVKYDVHSNIGSLYITFTASTKVIYLLSHSIGPIKKKIKVDYDVDYYPYVAANIPVSRFSDTPGTAATYGECVSVDSCIGVDWCDLNDNAYIVRLKPLPSSSGTIVHIVAHVNQRYNADHMPLNVYLIGSDQPELRAVKRTFLSGPVLVNGRMIQKVDAYINSNELPYWAIYLSNFANATGDAEDVHICYSYTVGAVRDCPSGGEIFPQHQNQEDVCKVVVDYRSEYLANKTRQLYVNSNSKLFVSAGYLSTYLTNFNARLLTASLNRLTLDMANTDIYQVYYVRILHETKQKTLFTASTGLVDTNWGLTVNDSWVCFATDAKDLNADGKVAYSFKLTSENLLSWNSIGTTSTATGGSSLTSIYHSSDFMNAIYYTKFTTTGVTLHQFENSAAATAGDFWLEHQTFSPYVLNDICYKSVPITLVNCNTGALTSILPICTDKVGCYFACQVPMTANATNTVTVNFGNFAGTKYDMTVVYGKYNAVATPNQYDSMKAHSAGAGNVDTATFIAKPDLLNPGFYSIFFAVVHGVDYKYNVIVA